MKYLKTYQLFEAKRGLSKKQEEFLSECINGNWSFDPSSGLVDVEGDFDGHQRNLMDFKGIRFGKVRGDFNCSWNNLTSLEGAPQEVYGYFDCKWNNLTSLEGAPGKVGGDYHCSYNVIESLVGSPQVVVGDFDCSNNSLKSLIGAPQEVGDYFRCWKNELTNLEGAPQVVGGGFDCTGNKLTSLEGAPQKVGGAGFGCYVFELESAEWNIKGWLDVLKTGTLAARSLILTLISPEALNKQIARDPAGMIMELKPVWNDKSFKEIRAKLVWPKGYSDDADLVGDLDDVGF
jgi:hypothetical protein